MLRAIPALAIAPLVILWVGLGETAKLFIVVITVLFPVYLNTLHGVRSVDPQLVEMAKVYKLRGYAFYRELSYRIRTYGPENRKEMTPRGALYQIVQESAERARPVTSLAVYHTQVDVGGVHLEAG